VDTDTITHLSLCSGYGGIDLGLKRIFGNRLRTLAYAEIEGFAIAHLVSKAQAGHLDDAPIWSDLRSFPWGKFHGLVGILSGGFPCQPFSAAGKRGADSDPRHLFPHILDGITQCRPSLVFLENVEGIVSAKLAGDGWRDPAGTPVLLHALRELERVGYEATAGIFSASEVGAPHQRKRAFILAYDQSKRIQGCWTRWVEESRSHDEKGLPLCGGDAGCGELAESVSNGESWGAWPSRPGQPQHGWEPPRVVGGLAHTASQRSGSESGDALHEGWTTSETGRESLPQDAGWTDGAAIPDNKSTGGEGPELGNAECVLLSTAGEHGAMDEASGIPADGEGSEPSQADSDASLARSGEAMANPVIFGRRGRRDGDAGGLCGEIQTAGSCCEREQISKTEPALGRNAPRRLHGVDLAELSGLSHQELAEICEWMVRSDNRTDELRLLGNGVVPAAAERAFRVLWDELIK